MKTKLFLLGTSLFFACAFASGQMINGSFENYTPPSDYDYSIEGAQGWHNLNNTCDLCHPSNTLGGTASHQPRTGIGNARFGCPTNGLQEFFYGTTQPLTAGTTYVVSF